MYKKKEQGAYKPKEYKEGAKEYKEGAREYKEGGREYKEGAEEHKGPPRRLTPPPPRVPKEHIVVTIDTEIPPMPEKHHILPKPNWEANYKKDYDIYRTQINKLKDEKVKRSLIRV